MGRYSISTAKRTSPTFHPERLDEAKKDKMPSLVFIGSETDFFQEDLSNADRDKYLLDVV
jgi:hypothetical protein